MREFKVGDQVEISLSGEVVSIHSDRNGIKFEVQRVARAFEPGIYVKANELKLKEEKSDEPGTA